MAAADIHFHDRLNDFLPPPGRGEAVAYKVSRRAAIKDVIESLGPPHTEIDVILVDGTSVGFEHILTGGERVDVYPWITSPQAAHHLRPTPPACPRFVLDAHLGRLARYLRMLGFDSRYRNDIDDAEIADLAEREQRVVLTRDRALLKRGRIHLAHFVRQMDSWRQLEEICEEFNLYPVLAPFTRCTLCNGRLARIEKAAVTHRLEPLTRRHVEEFLECEACGQLFWHGSHVSRMETLVERLRQRAPGRNRH